MRPSSVPRPMPRLAFALAALSLFALACEKSSTPQSSAAASASATPPPATMASAAPVAPLPPPLSREGQALARSPTRTSTLVYIADEDHSLLHRVALGPSLQKPPPIAVPPTVTHADADEQSFPLPGRPAQIIALADRLLITIRDPGLLLVLRAEDPSQEIARVPLPADAWGLAVSPDLATAYVTSAWTHKISAVDLGEYKVRFTLDTAREPRGVVASADGSKVYITHLIGAPLTLVDLGSGQETPKLSRLSFPPDPLRTHYNETISASLGYAAILSPDGRRLFVARHALGSGGAWQGSPTIDVLFVPTNTPVAPVRKLPAIGTLTQEAIKDTAWAADGAGPRIATSSEGWVQPRAMVYRKKTHHLLVASEGMSVLAELDALSISPGVLTNRFYTLGGLVPTESTKIQIPPYCGAPTGVVLSDDEDVAWVYCRTTNNLAAVRLTPNGARETRDETSYIEDQSYKVRLSPFSTFAYARLTVPPEPEDLALGRRLFHDATEIVVSGGMACAGCHPEGRDDGHVWREIKKYSFDKFPTFIAGPSVAPTDERNDGIRYGVARQTPMLAGRVDAAGPYGWHGESPDLIERIKGGFILHRWWDHPTDGLNRRKRAEPIAIFVRKGLVLPPREARPLTEEEERGKAIFMSNQAQCASCHVPKTGFTDGNALPLRGFKARHLFDEDPNRAYKVPSLLFVGSTPPYYHDGSFETLEDLVDKNLDRMGHTSHLSAEERKALVAYLNTL